MVIPIFLCIFAKIMFAMDKTYKFAFEMTEEQVKEMDEALRERQLRYYAANVEATTAEEKREPLRKFMVLDEMLNQFDRQVVEYKLQ